MRMYDNYKPSGVEWIGEIPSHWKASRLKFQGESIIGITYSPDDVSDAEYGTLVLRSSNIQDGKLAFEDCVFVDKSIKEKYRTKEGDILICARNGSAHLVGKSAYIDSDNEGHSFGAFMSVVRSALGRFLFYFFNSQVFKAQSGLFSTSTINQLTSHTLNNMVVSFPDDHIEQTAIANYLDQKTAAIDELIADKKRLLELYEEEKTAIINECVTGKKVWNGQAWTEPAEVKDSGIEWLGEIPKHWEVKRLKYVGSITLGKMLTKENKGDMHLRPYLRAANIGWINVDVSELKKMWFSDQELQRLKLQKNDLLVSEGGEVGRTCIWKGELDECYIQNSVHKVRMNDDCDPEYFLNQFFLFGVKGAFDLIVNRISIAHLTVEKLKEIEFIVPPQSEQKQIAEFVNSTFSQIEFQTLRTLNLINLLTEYRTALISEVVTGKVKVV